MTLDRKERLDELAAGFANIENRRLLMAEFGDIDTMLTGNNEDGEMTNLHISYDSILVETFQTNGWVRQNWYDADGQPEGESYDGRWK